MTAPRGPERHRRWLRCVAPLPTARIRLVCFPHAGGAASGYATWPARMAPFAEVLAVQYPGREERHDEPFAAGVDELADGVAAALAALVPGRYALFGHSLGATVAHEVARRAHRPPEHLVVSGRLPPPELRPGSVHLRDDDGLVAELTELGGTAAALLTDPEMRALVLPRVRADYRVAETYRPRPGPPLQVPVTAVIGDADPRVDERRARRWAETTAAGFDLEVLPGDHFYLTDQREALLALLRRRLGLPDVVAARWPSTP
ncbi:MULTISPECIES: thioesterase II family protein [Pseudonocardia]|uniref:Linear gramicidin dehydrogenase LgrE n=2 Tax=Pseudonocardia TaxID=1847 RepID=A0A1Y2N166_PSEAH|nr:MULTISPECIES: alpha/beta fold hydrolase [Pseudonocardia]OSY40837.1 Linear gramicidin dehydrogenase LgrE [Pseudonocardia autotrophica]TDN71855.1 pyochelin biosynthetic protein PchC [Pseudonocardia autotrophica]BBG02543.1 thioesterase [Pseudonocardia autotrophica]GEC29306.1 thioesterase [Pseudonocardia saturnea]